MPLCHRCGPLLFAGNDTVGFRGFAEDSSFLPVVVRKIVREVYHLVTLYLRGLSHVVHGTPNRSLRVRECSLNAPTRPPFTQVLFLIVNSMCSLFRYEK